MRDRYVYTGPTIASLEERVVAAVKTTSNIKEKK